MILTALGVIGWPLGVFFALVATWCLYRLAHTPKHPNTGNRVWNIADGGYWFTGLMFAIAAVADFTAVGLIGVVAGATAAGTMLVLLLALARPWQWADRRERRQVLFSLRTNPGSAVREFARDAGGLWRGFRGLRGGAPEPEAASPEAAVAEAVATRGIPSVMDDPALGLAPEPAELANPAVPVPSPWAALAEYIRGREPSDDGELRMFTEGDAAGALAVADARHAFADTCLNTLGLDPAYVAGVLETGDSMAEHATMLAQVHKRFGVIYGAVQEWVAAHGPLPHKAREWLTGGM